MEGQMSLFNTPEVSGTSALKVSRDFGEHIGGARKELWCSQRTSSLLKIGEPKHRLLRGKVAYDTPEMKRIGREIKRKLQKDLRGTGFEVHSNLRFRF